MINILNKGKNLLFLATMVAFGSACGTYAKIQRPVPANYNLGASKTLVVAEMSTGKRSYRELVMEHLTKQGRDSSWWRIDDATEKGITFTIQGDNVSTAPETPKEGEVFVKIDIYDVEVDSDTEEKTITDSNGNQKVQA